MDTVWRVDIHDVSGVSFILGDYLLSNSMNKVHIEKITVAQLVKKFPDFYANRTFITVFIRVGTKNVRNDS
jgi:hypothetical protein